MASLYCAVPGEERVPANSLVLKRVLPITQAPEEAVKEVCAQYDLAADELEESLRVRSVEWELLPVAVQALIRDSDENLQTADFAEALGDLAPIFTGQGTIGGDQVEVRHNFVGVGGIGGANGKVGQIHRGRLGVSVGMPS